MALHFNRAEYDRRIRPRPRRMAAQGLDGLLMFQQESMYYLTGYDTFGFCFFQCLYLGADGRLALLTRSADLRQAQHTSIIEDIRIWTDAGRGQARHPAARHAGKPRLPRASGSASRTSPMASPISTASGRCGARRLLQAHRCQRPRQHDPRGEVARPNSNMCARRASWAMRRLKAAIRKTKAGADEGEILAAQQAAVFAGRRRLSGQ